MFWLNRLEFIANFSLVCDQINFIESSNLKAQRVPKLVTMLTRGSNKTFEFNSTLWTDQRLPQFFKDTWTKASQVKILSKLSHGTQKESTHCWKFPLRTVANTALIQLCENNLTWDPMKNFKNQTFELWTWSNNFKFGTFPLKLVNL